MGVGGWGIGSYYLAELAAVHTSIRITIHIRKWTMVYPEIVRQTSILRQFKRQTFNSYGNSLNFHFFISKYARNDISVDAIALVGKSLDV